MFLLIRFVVILKSKELLEKKSMLFILIFNHDIYMFRSDSSNSSKLFLVEKKATGIMAGAKTNESYRDFLRKFHVLSPACENVLALI
jgi:hypothetical protein